jgi:hypothetical protein
MSLDERIRSSLAEASESIAGDVDDALTSVVQRSSTRRRRRRMALAAVVTFVAGGAALVAVRSESSTRTQISTASAPATSTTTGTTTVPDESFCPYRYRFAYIPDGWRAEPEQRVLFGPTGGAVKMALVTGSTVPTEIGHLEFVGLAATERTDGQGTFELRADDPVAAACGGQLAVVGTGISQQDFELVATAVEPVYTLADRQRFHSVWPSSDLADVMTTAGSDGLIDPEHAAISFAVDQLGWNGGEVVDKQPAENGTNGADLVIRENPGGPTVRVLAVPLPGTGYWAVASASTLESEFGFEVELHEDPTVPSHVGAGFRGATSAELQLRYGSDGVDLAATDIPAAWTFSIPPHSDVPGALVIRWRDAAGTVVALHAISVPPGDFAAG